MTSSTATGWHDSTVTQGFRAAWDRELFGIEIPAWRTGVVNLLRLAAGTIASQRPLVVADMGCGAGTYARHMLAEGLAFDYHGYDCNVDVLQAARARWAYLPDARVSLHSLEIDHLPWNIDSQRFDVVIWDTTLRFCEHVPKVLREGVRICRGWNILARTPLEARAYRDEVIYYDMGTPSTDWHFDAAMLQQLATDNRQHVSFDVGCDGIHVFSHDPLPEVWRLPQIIRQDQLFHRAYVMERISRLFAEHGSSSRWFLWGAGLHTRWLLSVLPASLRGRIAGCLDDHPQQSMVDGVPVLPASLWKPDPHDHVLVSSDTIEEKLFHRVIDRLGDRRRVFRLYEGMPAGPYEKDLSRIDFTQQDGIRRVASAVGG